jgi:hypothetical protein
MITDRIEEHIPKYLTPAEQAELVEQLRDFESRPFYTKKYAKQVLQGDGWANLQIFNFLTGERAQIKGLIFSNSCDISIDNQRDIPPKIVFAPLVPLRAYEEKLAASGKLDTVRIESKLAAIRKQLVTSLLYLPKGGGLQEECIAILDDVHSMPRTAFFTSTRDEKLFTLSQMGFYLFVLKISIHFCRFQEGISRSVFSGD